MVTPESATATHDSTASGSGELQPFPGHFVPGACFESGHCVWLLEFTSTPTRFDSYTELWLIAPDGERVLYTDPGAAADEVLNYHEFDRTADASITCRFSRSTVDVAMEGADETSLELTASVGQTLGTRVLNAVIAATPGSILRSRFGTRVSTLSVNLLLDANGLKVAGRTETDRRYRLDADRTSVVRDATATLNGTDLGPLQPPGRPVEFGDAKTTADALYIPGTLHLERFDR